VWGGLGAGGFTLTAGEALLPTSLHPGMFWVAETSAPCRSAGHGNHREGKKKHAVSVNPGGTPVSVNVTSAPSITLVT
jgi:hypothetical protein